MMFCLICLIWMNTGSCTVLFFIGGAEYNQSTLVSKLCAKLPATGTSGIDFLTSLYTGKQCRAVF